MAHSSPERSLYIGDVDEEDRDDILDDEEEEGEEEGRDVYDSDLSETTSTDGHDSPHAGSRPGSYTTSWPQSYRQSMDMYTSVTPKSIGFLGTPTLSRLSDSFLSSSFLDKRTPDLGRPFLPKTHSQEDQIQKHEIVVEEQRKSSHDGLFLSRRSSSEKTTTTHGYHGVSASGDCSYVQAALNGINVLSGVGILSTPYAIREGGWGGMVFLFMFAMIAWYTGVLLRKCLDSSPGLQTYPDIGEAAFGTTGRFLVSVILYLELYACCVEYIILESDNLSSLFPGAELNILGMYINSKVVFAVLTTLVVLPTTWLRDLSLLSYFSGCGVLASILVVLCLLWVGVVDKVGFHSGGSGLKLPTLPIAVGLYGYCYSGHAVFPNIYTSLKKPGQFPSVLFTCFAICTVLFAGAGVLGYTMFGESTESQFTLNLPHQLFASKIAIWTTVVNPITKFALTLTPLALSLEELIPSNYTKSHIYAIIIRSILTVSALIVALSVPFFGLVMSFVGSFFTMIVSFILPCVCFLRIVKGGASRCEVLLCSCISVLGAICCGFGTFSSISSIIKSLIN